MKVVYPTCCGVDVHKTFLVATIIKTTKGLQPSYQKKRFSTFNSDIRHFKQWLLDNSCFDVCMESTGKYWVPVFNLLEDQIHITIANPKWVKAVKGNKDDSKDSKWIGDLFRLGLVPGSLILTAVYQMLSTGETWNLYDLYKTDMPQQMQDKQKVKAVKQALKLLISEGMLSPESASTAV